MTKAERLLLEIGALQTQLARHQSRCKHPTRHLRYKLDGSTGNYDPTQDRYWTDFHCRLCQKKWTTGGQRDLRGIRV